MFDVAARLTAPSLGEQVVRLGFRDDDARAVLQTASEVAAGQSDLEHVQTLVHRLLPRIGDFTFVGVENPLDHPAARSERYETGVLPLLALLLTAPEVVAFHARRGIPDDVSWNSLADLGQQAWVHRRTFQSFGLHTYPWLRIAWSGALFWLGRLQFNLQQVDGEWVLSTHVPATGPLAPAAVSDSFARATVFFAKHFPDYPTTSFYCSSWLLDPALAAVMAPESNLAAFQRRWRLYGEPMRGDEDAIFFTFSRRGAVDPATLPRHTTLQRAIVDRLLSGRHWSVWQGRIAQETPT